MPQTAKTLKAFAGRAVLFAALWWALTGGAPASWAVGAPTVVVATLLCPGLPGGLPLRPGRGAVRFLLFFLWHSLRGGIDVASRALHPQMPLEPGFVRFRWRLPPGSARVFLADITSLLPGTLSTDLDCDSLTVHVLDLRLPFASSLRALEARVADLFGLDAPGKEG